MKLSNQASQQKQCEDDSDSHQTTELSDTSASIFTTTELTPVNQLIPLEILSKIAESLVEEYDLRIGRAPPCDASEPLSYTGLRGSISTYLKLSATSRLFRKSIRNALINKFSGNLIIQVFSNEADAGGISPPTDFTQTQVIDQFFWLLQKTTTIEFCETSGEADRWILHGVMRDIDIWIVKLPELKELVLDYKHDSISAETRLGGLLKTHLGNPDAIDDIYQLAQCSTEDVVKLLLSRFAHKDCPTLKIKMTTKPERSPEIDVV